MSAPSSLPPWIRLVPDGVILTLMVQPRASKNEVVGEQGGELKVRVTAPPVDSAANQALVQLFADLLDLPKGSVSLAKGASSRHKQILVRNLAAAEIVGRLV